ncbi:hypothetical protein LZG00_02755 [Rhodobacteraceae bacterium LMO-12]|nr:hypothetical protein [Rhodobacteraceae bacterium LMO-JJ12]
MEKRLVQSLIIRNDLEEAKSEILQKGLLLSIAHVKIAFLAFHNLCDFERSIRYKYADHRELSELFDKCRSNAEFFSYLRNKFTGQLTDDLIEKSLEWKPEISLTLGREHDSDIILIYNFWLLETAINTYVDAEGNHKVFDSETDLMYPPDFKRFESALTTTVDQAVEFLSAVEAIFKPFVSSPTTEEEKMELFQKAGLTNFYYLKKGGR